MSEVVKMQRDWHEDWNADIYGGDYVYLPYKIDRAVNALFVLAKWVANEEVTKQEIAELFNYVSRIEEALRDK